MKLSEREKAIELRKKGMSLNDIRKFVPVAKSTLSLWLREVGLSKKQYQRLTEKKLAAARRGALKRKTQRIESTEKIKELSRNEIIKISDRDLFLLGVALYWAEGAKQKEYNVSQALVFANSDPIMLKLFLKWLTEFAGVKKEDIKFEIYLHIGNSVTEAIKHWSQVLKRPKEEFKYIYFKKGNPKTKRRNIGDQYFGLVRIKVARGTDLSRRISGWVEGIANCCEIV